MPIYKMKGSKDGKQKYRVRINYQDSMGINRQIDRVTYGNAEAKELERQLNYDIKQSIPAKRITVKQLYEEYLKSKKHELREQSIRSIVTYLDNHVIPELGNLRLDKLTTPALKKWKDGINEKTVKNKGVKKLSIKTKQHIYNEFRTMLNYAVQMDYIEKNPLKKIGNFKSSITLESEKEMDYYTPDEFKLYIKAAYDCAKNSSTNHEWDYYVFFNIAYYTGLRKGEIHALKWSDIEGDYLHVTRSIAQKLKGADRETPPKNKSSIRTIQIPIPLKEILNAHTERYKQLEGFNNDYRICGGITSLRDSTLDKHNKKYAELAGIKKIRIHDFRHSHASLLANEGINIQEIARRLGHSKIEITWNTYSHLYPREEERAINILNKIV